VTTVKFVATCVACAVVDLIACESRRPLDEEEDTDKFEVSAIFIGSNEGKIYSLTIELDILDGVTPRVSARKVYSSFWRSLVPFLARWPVVSLVYDDTTKYLAALESGSDERSTVRFFRGGSDPSHPQREVFVYEGQPDPSQPDEREQIVSIEAVPLSDSATIRFVCFTRNGERLVFGQNRLDEDFDALQRVDGLPSLSGAGKVTVGTFHLNQSSFIYEWRQADGPFTSLVVVRPRYLPHAAEQNPPERAEEYEVPAGHYALNFVRARHPLADRPLSLFKHELL
jgi:hypothetical protein